MGRWSRRIVIDVEDAGSTCTMDRLFQFRSNDELIWQLKLSNGRWFTRQGDCWVRVAHSYLDQPWYFRNGCWNIQGYVADDLTAVQFAFGKLAFEVLPHWNNQILATREYSAYTIKEWSHWCNAPVR